MQNSDNKRFSLARSTVKKDRKMLLSGVLILTVASIAVKIFGFLYKVPLNGMLGDEMANVNAAYSIYTTLLVLSTAGIPSAVAMMVSSSRVRGESRRVSAVFSVSLRVLTVIGAIFTVLMLALARPIAEKNSGGDSLYCMLAIAPSLLFVCIISVYRGYFQGFQIMTPTAVSEIIESFGKMVMGLLFSYLALNVFSLTASVAAALSVVGISVSMGLATIYLVFTHRIYKRRGRMEVESCGDEEEINSWKLLAGLASVAVPIALSSAVISMAGLVDSQFMRPLLAQYYGDDSVAKAIYSDYSTGAITLFNMPSVLIYPIACAIIPYINSSLAANDRKGVSEVAASALKMASVISLPCALGMSVLAAPILEFVFRGDVDMGRNAGYLLSVLAPAVFLIGILSVSNAILQAHRRQGKPIISMLMGLAAKIISSMILVPKIGAVGTPISTLVFYLMTVIVNMWFLMKYTTVTFSFAEVFGRPFSAAAVSAAVAYLTYRALSHFGGSVALPVAIAAAVVIYIVSVFLFGCIKARDLERIPKGEKISKILNKLKLLR